MSERVSARRGRTKRRRITQSPDISVRRVVREIPVYELLDPDGVATVHAASMDIVERIGIEFRDQEAIASWRKAGADIDGTRVRIPRELLMEKAAETRHWCSLTSKRRFAHSRSSTSWS